MMMKIATCLIVVSGLSSISYGQTSEELYMNRVYQFINSTLFKDTISFNLSDKPSFGLFADDTTTILKDSLFTQSDRDYFRVQFAQLGKINWQAGKINGATIIPHREIKRIFRGKNGWITFRKKYKKCLTTLSLPIFNVNHDYCIMYQWTQCDYLLGAGSTNLYKLENGKWIFIECYSMGRS